MSVQRIKFGRPTYLNSDEESLVVASVDIEGARGLPIYVNTLGAELQCFIKKVNARQSTKDTPTHMNYSLVKMWNFIQQQSASVIIDAFFKTKLLPLSPPDHNTNSQACLAATQTPLGTKSKIFIGPKCHLEKSRPSVLLTQWSSLDQRGDHQVTSLLELKIIILSNRGKFSPFKKSRQMRWKWGKR